MNGNLWFDWLNYIRTAHSAELFFALYLSTAFCARITEVLMLRAQDFDWDREQVHFGAFKYGKSTDKPMVPSVKKQLLGVKRNGIVCPSKWVNCGARGWQLQDRTYRFPSSGFLFPSRNGAKEPHHNKDWVIHAICDLRDAFIEKYERRYPSLNGKKPRSHSGRRHAVTWMTTSGVETSVGMSFAVIRDGKVYNSYADIPPEMVRAALKAADKASPLGRQTRKL